MKIDALHAVEAKDSRGKPTVEVRMRSGDIEVSAKVPSGKSAGSREALELRDENGTGVTRALENVEKVIAPALTGNDVDPTLIDKKLLELDGTDSKSKFGANATLGVSMAGFRLAASLDGIPLWKYLTKFSGAAPAFPRLYMNMLNGGAHADFRLPFQEYIVVVGGESPTESYEHANRIFAALGALIHERFGEVPMGDEGGYSPAISDIETPFRLLHEVIDAQKDGEIFLAIDAAASEFYKDGSYAISGEAHDVERMLDIYRTLAHVWGVKSIEDPFDETDLPAFEAITKELGSGTLIVGDDLTVTNPTIVREMIDMKRANAMIVKPNQIGTISETLTVAKEARDAGWKLIASHRSGETDDTFIADLAVAIGAYGLKAGAPTQRERRVKYERLIEIEREFTS